MNLLVRLLWVRWFSTRQLEFNPSESAKNQVQSHSIWGQRTKAWVDNNHCQCLSSKSRKADIRACEDGAGWSG